LSDCENAACQANCPVTDPSSLIARQDCASEADQSGCVQRSGIMASCPTTGMDAGLAEACANSGFKAFYDAVVPLFCGQPSVDAAAAVDAGGAEDAALSHSVDGGVPTSDAGID
jgi:hypothetical protein